MAYTEIHACRICGNRRLNIELDLGIQAMTGLFPPRTLPDVPIGPLVLARCVGGCALVQLKHAFAIEDMYGSSYGYRSGLNAQMVAHLQEKVQWIRKRIPLAADDIVLDIGSNDGTLLGFNAQGSAKLIGIDPSAEKFRSFYRPDITLKVDFFSADAFLQLTGGQRASVITSIAMFYDLEHPQLFVDDIARALKPNGIWHFEQSYLPAMLSANAYDTICHEHSEYYALAQIEYMLERAGMKVIDVSLNDTNGGSFAVTAAHIDAEVPMNQTNINELRAREHQLNLAGGEPFQKFADRVKRHPTELREALARFNHVVGYGASTKGNVLLQYCKLGPADLPMIAEVNSDKFGCVTPGTRIPIVSEADARQTKPDAMLVMPWHFRQSILNREAEYLRGGGRLIFPLPKVEIV